MSAGGAPDVSRSSPAVDDAALASSANLDGDYLYLAPLGGVLHTESTWTGVFGVSASWIHVREHRPLAALGVSLGGFRFTDEARGRLSAELVVGTRRLTGDRLLVGVALGPVVQVDDLRHPRMGARGRIWCHAGVVPYVGFGVLDRSGSFFEVGLEVSLPAVRW